MSEKEVEEWMKCLQQNLRGKKSKLALSFCEKIFAVKREKDIEVLKIYLLLLHKLRQFSKFTELCASYPKISESLVPYERCLVMFSSGAIDECHALFIRNEGKMKEKSEVGTRLLEAQILYKKGEFQESSEVYKLVISKFGLKTGEVFTNYVASLIMAGNHGGFAKEFLSEYKVIAEKEEMFEYFYNLAIAFSESHELETAGEYLESAKKLCRQTLEKEEYQENEIQALMTPIKVQMGYISQIIGEKEKAIKIYNEILVSKPKKQEVSMAVAGNNLASMIKSQSVFEAERRMKYAKDEKVKSKLTKWQIRGINLNEVLLFLKMKKFEEAKKLMRDIEEQFPGTDIPSLVESSLLYKEKKFEEATKCLSDFINNYKGKEDEKIVRAEISLAQLFFNKGEVENGMKVLGKSQARFHLALVGVLIGYYRSLGSVDECLKIFEEGVVYWRKMIKECTDDSKRGVYEGYLVSLLREYAEFHVTVGNLSKSVGVYEEILKIDPKNKTYIARMVISLVKNNLDSALKYLSKLPKLDVTRMKPQFLERIPLSMVKEKKTKGAIERKKKEKELEDTGSDILFKKKGEKEKRKNKRKNKKPKNYDPSKLPDPERWLPKYERSGYKKMNQKKWQGSAVDAKLEMKKKVLSEQEKKQKRIENIILSKQNKGKGKKKRKKRKNKRK